MLLSVLCLFGCSSSESEPQSVAFETSEYKFSQEGGSTTINVYANCPWNITGGGKGLILSTTSGEGNMPIFIDIIQNDSYDELHYTLTVTSEDGTSTDILAIHQRNKMGLEIGKISMISENGGTFELPVRTNDKITVDTPDWITFTESRALAGYTYAFTAEPNKTGSVRNGTITLKGESISNSIEVTQNSFTPDSAWVDVPICVVRNTSEVYPVHVTPEYADFTKVKVSEESPRLWAKMTDEGLHLEFSSIETNLFEEVEFQLEANDKIVSKYTVGVVKPEIYMVSDRYMYYPGEHFYITTLPEPYGKMEYSNPEVIQKTEDGRLKALKNGECTITVTSAANGYSTSKTYIVYDVALEGKLFGRQNLHDDVWEITFRGTARGKCITQYIMYLTFNEGTEKTEIKEGTGTNDTYSVDYTGRISIEAKDNQELNQKIPSTFLHFEGVVDGKGVYYKKQIY